jgi:hypothetical protein
MRFQKEGKGNKQECVGNKKTGRGIPTLPAREDAAQIWEEAVISSLIFLEIASACFSKKIS